ncbi:MAG: type II toxin-antitoxin system HicB family antitoxin [Planctomycetes bacterium]|nr:type II toxin-antitoxin system HicB family antitoxin [Planctomycetota bacterium]
MSTVELPQPMNRDFKPMKIEVEGKTAFECRVRLCPEEGGGYSAHALLLPGVVSQGETITEALENITEAFQGSVASYREAGENIPWGTVDVDEVPKGSVEKWILVYA